MTNYLKKLRNLIKFSTKILKLFSLKKEALYFHSWLKSKSRGSKSKMKNKGSMTN